MIKRQTQNKKQKQKQKQNKQFLDTTHIVKFLFISYRYSLLRSMVGALLTFLEQKTR